MINNKRYYYAKKDCLSFNKICKDNYIYVDKTDTIAKFIGNIGSYFLSRPSRFGKSSLINTLDVCEQSQVTPTYYKLSYLA